MNSLQQFQQALLKIQDLGTERTHYPVFCEFLRNFYIEIGRANISATAEETSTQHENRVGFPDITLRDSNRLIGWIEVKLPEDDLGNNKFEKQFKKYKDSLENIIFTNFRQWELWQWDDDGKPKKIEEVSFDVRSFPIGAEENLKRFLIKFFEGQAYDARTPKQLALALAKKTKLLSQQVEENFTDEEENGDLHKLKKTFSETLIQDISEHQFANMVAETLAYSLFLASLEYTEKNLTSQFTLTTAIDFLPKNVPILRDLYDLVKRIAAIFPTIHQAAQSLVDQLNNAELERIRHKLIEHKIGEDPVIQFYEPFLNEYDPKEREARGVYYTPKPVVDFIVRSVDHLLETKFGKENGLANEDVNILDPATGTGTFLMSAIQQVHHRIKKQNEALGEDIVRKKFNDIVLHHILKHFYGFELLVAPYAVAHLKLTLEIERLGFDFQSTYDDNDSENNRFQVFLANTLDNPDAPPKDLFGFESIAKESEQARHVKKNKPILAIIGNPPYSNFGQMNRQPWILELLDDYKKNLGEKKINLDDDYIKFIRFAEWKINQTGQGIFAMITSNSFLDGITHRRMREDILKNFDEIYIYNLHGNSRKGEVCPDGSKDENVFNIQTGVSINIFVKKENTQEPCKVYSADAWGYKQAKYEMLNQAFNEVAWKEVDYLSFNSAFLSTKWSDFLGKLNYFVPNADDVSEKMVEYGVGWGMQEIFNKYNSGIQTKKDELTIKYDEKDLELIINDFKNLSESELKMKYVLVDTSGWKTEWAMKDIKEDKYKIVPIDYRPFDKQWAYYSGKSGGFVGRPRTETMSHMLQSNLAIVTTRLLSSENFCHLLCTTEIIESAYVSNKTKEFNYLFPIYLYPETENTQSNLLGEKERKANINSEFLEELSEKLNLQWLNDGRGDLSTTFGPEDMFYYAYAILHCPTYRTRYAEQLKIDFPRLPLTSDQELFRKLVRKGNELVNLHLLGENPFDDSETIFDDNSKWDVRTGGEKPANVDDWKVEEVEYRAVEKRVYVNAGQYFEGIEKEIWEFMIGGYQVLEKWLKDRKKAERCLSADDLIHYMKVVVSLRETIRVMKEIDELIPVWPLK